jgi:hypothetical protein
VRSVPPVALMNRDVLVISMVLVALALWWWVLLSVARGYWAARPPRKRRAEVRLRYTGGDQAHPATAAAIFRRNAQIAVRTYGLAMDLLVERLRTPPDLHEQDRWSSFPRQMVDKVRQWEFLERLSRERRL